MKKRIAALALAFAMVMGTAAAAAGVEKTISITPMDLTVNGQAVTATGSNGATGEVFASGGVTYAPVRYLCELLGIDVAWDKDGPNTVKLVGDNMNVPAASVAYTPGTYTGVGTGMGGQVKVAVTFSADAITAVTVGENNETPGIGTAAIDQLPDRIVESQSLALDAVSGATLTSKAILDAVADAATQAGGNAAALRSAPVKTADTAKTAEEYTADVCVIGAGGAGLFGALEAAEAGASVIVLEKSATALASNSNQIGGTCAVESVLTKANGETYTKEQLTKHLLDYSHYTVNSAAVTKLVDLMSSTIDIFQEVGVEFTLGADRFNTGFRDVHSFVTQNKFGLIEKRVLDDGAKILYQCPGKELIMENGKVAGVKAEKADGTPVIVHAKAVLIATGGFLGNEEMMKEHFGDVNVRVMTGVTTCTGDGINMALDAGAQLGKTFAISVNDLGGTNSKSSCMDNFGVYMMDRNQALTFGMGCGLFVNSYGDRFFNEYVLANEPLASGGEALLHAGPNGYYYTVISQSLVDSCLEKGYFKSIGSPEIYYDAIANENSPVIMHNTPLPRLQEDLELGIQEGWVWKADTIEALAAQVGMDNLVDTVASYDAMCKAGKDTQFGKPASLMTAIGEGPYYLIEYHAGSWCTMGGIVTDENMNALTPAMERIPGLYVAGGDNGSIYSAPYYDVGGTSSGMAFASGRLAGMRMAEYVSQ